MRENWDYVTMDAYSADMAELSGTAAAAIEKLTKENTDARRLIAMLVIAAGGKINLPQEWYFDPRRDITTIFETNPVTQEYVIRAHWTVRASAHAS